MRQRPRRQSATELVKTEFLHLASHELRGPLAVVGGYLSMIEDETFCAVPEPLREVVPIMTAKVAEITQLVDQMLDTARLDEGHLRLRCQPLDLVPLAGEVVRTWSRLASPGHRLRLQTEAPGLPVLGDGARLRNVLGNLVSNAIKYSPDGGTVSVTLRREGETAVVEVADRGLGMTDDHLDRLFTRFGRMVTAENGHIPGSGLGLYLSRELARLHGGDITVESEPGRGSTFWLRLPSPSPVAGAVARRAGRHAPRPLTAAPNP